MHCSLAASRRDRTHAGHIRHTAIRLAARRGRQCRPFGGCVRRCLRRRAHSARRCARRGEGHAALAGGFRCDLAGRVARRARIRQSAATAGRFRRPLRRVAGSGVQRLCRDAADDRQPARSGARHDRGDPGARGRCGCDARKPVSPSAVPGARRPEAAVRHRRSPLSQPSPPGPRRAGRGRASHPNSGPRGSSMGGERIHDAHRAARPRRPASGAAS